MPVTQLKSRARKSDFPQHAYADDHKLLLAAKEFGTRRRIRDAATLEPSGEVACRRIREYAYDLGELEYGGYRWIAGVARKLGMGRSCLSDIVHENQQTLRSETVDAVARATGIPPRMFYDAEI